MPSKMLSKGSINPSLLILANLTSPTTGHSKFDGSVSAKSIYEYINGMIHQKNTFHHYGLVRMLAWLPNDEKTTYIPRTITERKRFSVKLDLLAQVSEIAGCPLDESSHTRRQHDLAVRSERLAAQRAKVSRIWNPEHRRSPPSTPSWYEIGLVPDAFDQLRRLPHKFPWQYEMLRLDDKWSEHESKVEKESLKAKTTRRPGSEEVKKLRVLRSKFLTIRKAKAVAQEWAHRQSETDRVEILLATASLALPVLAARKELTQQKAAILHAEMGEGRKDLALLARRYIDDRRGFEQQPPLLQWDRRTAEPLMVRDEEFYPARKMALLDLNPSSEAVDKLSDFDKRTCFEYLLAILLRSPAQSVRNELATIAQGGLDDFIDRVPDLTNPVKGGNSNLDDLRIRTLPIHLLIQLALALETWPFRMQSHEMIMAIGRKQPNVLLEDE